MPEAVATFTPEGDHPRALGKVPLAEWTGKPKTKAGWNYVPGINWDIKEKPLDVPPGKHPAAGVIIEEDDGRIWLVAPTNAYGGYENTFPKGTCEDGLSIQANAIKEAWEESGLKVEIVGVLGDFDRTTSVARMYIARRTGGNPVDMGWESQAVRLVPKARLNDLLNMSSDKDIIKQYLSRKKDH
ncbi:NUDIX hydrolase [Salmonella enterica]|nr:NUDIX hydrolase [Salmonella enterica]EFO7976641.1 NUDIX hydrolase [Salmonella enterica]EGC0267599.1 NUDIX hydrolase [Salmonella enterica]